MESRQPEMPENVLLIQGAQDSVLWRSIVSGVKGPTETASWVLNEALKIILSNLPHLLLDTLEAIDQLENLHAQNNAHWLPLTLSHCIQISPQRKGTERVLKYYFNTPLPSHMPEWVARYLLRAVLSHNHFEFNRVAYRQKSGLAMGTKCAPTFANIIGQCGGGVPGNETR